MGLQAFKKALLEFIYPEHLSCYICGRDLHKKTKTYICDKCKKNLPFIKRPCNRCGKQVDEGEYCYTCAMKKFYFDKVVSVCEYDGLASNAVSNFKKTGYRYIAKSMAYYMYCAYKNSHIIADSIMCVPTSKSAIKKRGFDQTADLLNCLNEYLKLDVIEDGVVAVETGMSQKNLSYNERQTNAKNKFKVVHSSKFKDKTILVVDDVMTTGATMNNIAHILKLAGAKKVYGLTFASRCIREEDGLELPIQL